MKLKCNLILYKIASIGTKEWHNALPTLKECYRYATDFGWNCRNDYKSMITLKIQRRIAFCILYMLQAMASISKINIRRNQAMS